MNCCKCYKPIPELRLKALPNTKECIECSSEERNMVRAVITGKTTYSEIEVIKNKKTKEYLNGLIGKGRRGFGSMLHRSSGSDSSPSRVKIGTGSSRILRMPTKEVIPMAIIEAVKIVRSLFDLIALRPSPIFSKIFIILIRYRCHVLNLIPTFLLYAIWTLAFRILTKFL